MDVHGNTTIEQMLQAASNSATATGTGVDLLPYDGILKIVADVNAISGTNPTCDITIEDSADNSTGWATVTSGTFTQILAVDTFTSKQIDTNACKRYIRAVATLAGTNPVYIIAIHLVGRKIVI
jgi:hypothetical protein